MAITVLKRLDKGSELSFAEGDANLDELIDLSSTDNGKGASQIGIEDSADEFTATDVEGALSELRGLHQSSSTGNLVSRALVAVLNFDIQNNIRTPVLFTNTSYDTGSYYDLVNNLGRFVIPSGVNLAKFTYSFEPGALNLTGVIGVLLLRNGLLVSEIGFPRFTWSQGENDTITVSTALLEVVPGDYFTLETVRTDASTDTITSPRIWMSVEGYD